MAEPDIDTKALQKTSAEMIVLALLVPRSRHGYEIAKRSKAEAAASWSFMWLRSIRCCIAWRARVGSKPLGGTR